MQLTKPDSIFDLKFKQRAKDRIKLIQPILQEHKIHSVILAGGGLLNKFDDLDLFGNAEDTESNDAFRTAISVIGFNTFNAASLTYKGIKLQLCKYSKPTLKELVNSFDFAHCQIGAKVEAYGLEEKECNVITVQELYYTDAFIDSMISETTEYLGSEYPIASLVRLFKIKEKTSMSRVNFAGNTIRILNDIYKLKFKSYEEFKDQLDAIDLALSIDHLNGFEDDCHKLYKTLAETGSNEAN